MDSDKRSSWLDGYGCDAQLASKVRQALVPHGGVVTKLDTSHLDKIEEVGVSAAELAKSGLLLVSDMWGMGEKTGQQLVLGTRAELIDDIVPNQVSRGQTDGNAVFSDFEEEERDNRTRYRTVVGTKDTESGITMQDLKDVIDHTRKALYSDENGLFINYNKMMEVAARADVERRGSGNAR